MQPEEKDEVNLSEDYDHQIKRASTINDDESYEDDEERSYNSSSSSSFGAGVSESKLLKILAKHRE